MSTLLTPAQRNGLRKLGDIVIPGDLEFPSFSQAGCADAIDRMIPYMNLSDRDGVETLLSLFNYLPTFLIRGIFALSEAHRLFPEPIAGLLRLANIGMKGVVMTLYYSDVGRGVSVHQLIGWDAKVVVRESEQRSVA